MTTQTETTETTATQTVPYHWIATIQMQGGQISTYDGFMNVMPGADTHTSLYNAVRKFLTKERGAAFVVLYFSLAPDQL